MLSTISRLHLTIIVLLASSSSAGAQTVLSPFEGSVRTGIFETEFDAFSYAEGTVADPTLSRVEGSIVSRVLVKPAEKSNLEVFRSYERELQNSGFTVLLAATPAEANPQRMLRQLYRPPHNDLRGRRYRATDGRLATNDLGWLSTFGQYYLLASRTQGGSTLYVALLIADRNDLYLIDEVTTAAMETGTVTLNLEHMRTEIEQTGKIAIYDLYFATGSAAIEPASAAALAVIASYLGEVDGNFYVVGHTDDTGALDANLSLSERRAAAVKNALIAEFEIPDGRLETRGVGPLVPISNNTDEAGRALNRRVEIVQRLEDDQ